VSVKNYALGLGDYTAAVSFSSMVLKIVFSIFGLSQRIDPCHQSYRRSIWDTAARQAVSISALATISHSPLRLTLDRTCIKC